MKLDDLCLMCTILIFFYTLINESVNSIYTIKTEKKINNVNNIIHNTKKKIKYKIIIPNTIDTIEIKLNKTNKQYQFINKYLNKLIKQSFIIKKITMLKLSKQILFKSYLQVDNIDFVICILFINNNEFYLIDIYRKKIPKSYNNKIYSNINNKFYSKKLRQSKFYNKWII